MMSQIQPQLDLVLSQLNATMELLSTNAVRTLGTGRSSAALEDPLMKEIAKGLKWYVSAGPGQVDGVRCFLGYAEEKLGKVHALLGSWGADPMRPRSMEAPAPSLRIADHLLRPDEPRGVRIRPQSRKALPFLAAELHEATAIQDRLGAVVSTYRFAIGDYSNDDPAERRFTQVARHLTPHINRYHQDLLVIDRDRIERIVRSRSNEVMLIGVKANGFGTWSQVSKASETRDRVEAQIPSDCIQVVEVTRLGVRVAKKTTSSHLAVLTSSLATEAA